MGEGKRMVKAKDQEAGEAVAYLPPGEGSKSLWVFGELVTYKTKSERTGGAYSLFEVATLPGSGPPSHVQHREDESFYVLEGEYEFLVEGRTINAGAGSLIYIPRGTLHAHGYVGQRVGRMLVSQTPGGLHESFFEEIGKPTVDGSRPADPADRSNMQEITAIAGEYGIEIPFPNRSHEGQGGITG
jgi:quercetin dioxygenase-like cupin family protein